MTELEWDWNLGVPKIASNVFLSILIPEDEKFYHDTDSTFSKRLCKEILPRYDVANHRSLVVRGANDDTNIPLMQQVLPDGATVAVSDPDVLILVENTDKIVADDFSGDTRIIAAIQTLDAAGQFLLQASDTLDDPSLVTSEKVLRSDVFRTGVPGGINGGVGLEFLEPHVQNITVHPVPSPAWQTSYAWRCPFWPRAAQAWASRKRPHNWPTEQGIKDVVSEGCHVIPAPNEGGGKIKWQFSFAWAEQTLFSTLTPLQKHVFLLFKILHFQCLSHPQIVTTHHLRTIFLRACERLPPDSWREDQLTTLTMYLVDDLFHAFVNSTLPHYFLPEQDLLAGIDEDFQWEIQGRLVDMRIKALRHVLAFTQGFRFSWTPVISDSLAQTLLVTLEGKQHLSNAGQCLQQMALPLLMSYTVAIAFPDQGDISVNTSIDKAMEFLSYGLKLLQENMSIKLTIGDVIGLLIDASGSVRLQARLQEYVIEKFPDWPFISSLYSNLACIYHSFYWTASNDEQQELREKIEPLFEKALSNVEGRTAIKADYTNFLCRMGSWDKAINMLKEATTNELDPTEGGANAYDRSEMPTLDEDLQVLVQSVGKIQVLSTAYCLYLLVYCYRNINNVSEAEDTVERFASWCGDKFPLSENQVAEYEITSWVLLGLAYQQLSMPAKAFGAYKKALNCGPEWVTHLADRIQLVQGLAASADPSWTPNEGTSDETTTSQTLHDSATPGDLQAQQEEQDLQQAIALSLLTAEAEGGNGDCGKGLAADAGHSDDHMGDEMAQLDLAIQMSLKVSEDTDRGSEGIDAGAVPPKEESP